ncbi:Exopolyphosphatase-like protein [Ignavibacterium album JCM 16511]|uniref:Exopolyphosphatase-like protein n=1 Tax=Ignavibacterium album (strain DSM 19864 / JCM 16511 / NBRC 101810 / Mat9-16) TaxID=945713 RepID=I0AJQ4_IGNAJ|nr:bifunctional oligoribonuclease/PAP phosphatase NrnA [Ignavibacterium album]AFH49211.1 Exopolyphosphatase-like protein [Ignavibacterium album JCM 16511]
MVNFQKLKNIILSNNSFLITTHVNPDADAIGSEVAFYQLLKSLGKKSYIINHSETPYNLRFLDVDNVIKQFNLDDHADLFNQVDVLVALDFNRSDRTVSMKKHFDQSKAIKICLDHHQDPEEFVDYEFIDTDYSATGEIIFNLITESKIVPLTKQIAEPIYAAIMTDTGSFRFERTTAKLHRKIATLLETGINPTEIYDKIYDQSKFSKIKLLGRALESIQLIADGKIAFMIITQKDFDEFGAIESDTENFVNYNLSIENVVLGLLFIELKNGFKVSFRSKGNIPVNKLASEFGGGGHTNAAGARFFDHQMTQEMINSILNKAINYIK